ncbi:MAG: dienelactone hydrolase family protein [Planctomycetaceae bacterium]|nr:dienelactone hydrolase family protein [Planctomycetaceae bacterium]
MVALPPGLRRTGVALLAVALLATRFSLATADDYSASGEFLGGRQLVSVPRPDGTNFDAWLYYPATSNGLNQPVATAGGDYPIVAWGHPFVLGPLFNNSTLRHLATWGYVTIAPTTQGGFLPNHAALAADMRYGIDYVQSLHDNPASPFFGKLDTAAVGASGFSMGGGASLLAAAADSRIKAVANLAAAETFPSSAIAAMSQIQVPVRLVAGTADQTTPIAVHQQPMYDAGNAPTQLRAIVGGNHLHFQDFPLPSPYTPAQLDQLAHSRSELTAFFELYLKGDQSAWRSVWGPEAEGDPAFESQLNPGIVIEQLATLPGEGSLVHQLVVTNSGAVPDSYDLLFEGNEFDSQLSFLATPELAPGESFAFELTVSEGESFLVSDTALVSARSHRDGGTRGYALVTSEFLSLTGVALNAYSVPEPASWLLAASGIVVLALRKRIRA